MKALSLILISMSFLSTACVMTPTGEVVGPDVEVGVDLNPRVHTGSRSRVTVWLHPNFLISDAYTIAQRHCDRWGLWARPLRDWPSSYYEERYLNYTCVSYRPSLAYPHIIHSRPYYSRPYKRWKDRRRRVYTPAPVSPRRKTFGHTSSERPFYSRPKTEVGKPWQHKPYKKKVYGGRLPYKKKTEVGKPWTHNKYKAPSSTFKRSKRSSFGRKRSLDFNTSQRRAGRVTSKKTRRGSLSL